MQKSTNDSFPQDSETLPTSTKNLEVKYINEAHKIFCEYREKFNSYIKITSNSFYFGEPLPKPMITEGHILSKISDKQKLRDQLKILIDKKEIRSFQLNQKPFERERYFISEYDYRTCIKELNSPISDKFLQTILPNISTYSFHKEILTKEFSDDEIKSLVQMHVICLEDLNKYSLFVPHSGPFLQSVFDGRKNIVSYLKKCQNIVPYTNIIQRNIHNSIFEITFHLESLIGLGYIRKEGNDRVRLIHNPFI